MSIKKSINSFFSRLWINKSAIFKLGVYNESCG